MAINPYIVQIVTSQVLNEENRQRLIIGTITIIVIVILIILIPLFAITSTTDEIKSFFEFGEDGQALDGSYYSLIELNNIYAHTLTVGELEYNGTFPMPVQNAIVTSEFGSRIHHVTGKQSFHTGIDLAGVWHSNIIAVEKGTIVFAGIRTGYGNCVEIQHITNGGTIYYTFYAHLARIDIIEGQEIQKGTIIGIQGGDPKKDPNPGYSTGSHLHFEIRMSLNGDYLNPKEYLYGNREV